MPVTTVLSEEGAATIVSGGNDNDRMFSHRFSWSSAFAGAFVATATTFFLLALGAGFGLALVPVQHATTPTFLTLGAIYFLAAQAFGFAVGAHLAGRLIGPAPETAKEEEFRSAAHGLVVWALAVVATATLAVIGSFAIGGSAIAVAAASSRSDAAQTSVLTPGYIGYWTDMLFRPGPNPSQAALDWTQFAQADTGAATDAPPPTSTPAPPADNPETTPPAPTSHPMLSSGPTATQTPSTSSQPIVSSSPMTSPPPRDVQVPQASAGFVAPASLNADKAEVSRIITVGKADNGHLTAYDKERIAALVAQDTGLGAPEAQRRVDNAEARIDADVMHAAETARKTASYASLWIALSLLFGAIVSTMAAVSARWEDDRVTFGWPRREPE